ncbi:MAG: polysaccharide lyase beta-sandwich domain-containing protein, partial [Bacteroidales bacterium]|nr:polysaccharide lyase beta-sandwich domain-containing protein [Bacteroidales bacterium]
PVFKCWFDHTAALGETGSASYAFAILPCVSAAQTAAFFATLTDTETSPVRVLLNTRDCQAVEHSGVICAAIHTAGSYEVCGLTLQCDAPCLLIRDGASETREVLPEPLP